MSDQKLTDLSAAGALNGTELLYMVQAGNDVKVTAQAVADLGGGAVDSVNGQTGVVVLGAADVGAAATSHSHSISDVTNLQTTLDGKAATSHSHAISDVTGLQTALDGKQASGSYAAATHSHAISDVTGLQTALDGKQPLATVLTNTTAAFTTAQETKLSGIATAATANSSDASLRDRTTHTGEQAISTVTGLQTALDAKQATLVSATNIKTINGASVLGSGDLTVTGTGSEPVHFIQQGGNYTLTSTTSAQKIFNASTNGALTLPTGKYQFEMSIYLLSMSSSSGNAQFVLAGAGTATVASIMYQAVGVDANNPLSQTARSGSVAVTSASTTNILTGSSGTGMFVTVSGVFDVTAMGTIIPSIALNTAAAAVVQANSYFKCQKIAATGVTATSEWS
jgi:hypothetical protein